MDAVMTEHIKDKLIEFLSHKTTTIKKESMSSLKPFVSKPTFDLYLFHAYIFLIISSSSPNRDFKL